jgi:hypothetical protein
MLASMSAKGIYVNRFYADKIANCYSLCLITTRATGARPMMNSELKQIPSGNDRQKNKSKSRFFASIRMTSGF